MASNCNIDHVYNFVPLDCLLSKDSAINHYFDDADGTGC